LNTPKTPKPVKRWRSTTTKVTAPAGTYLSGVDDPHVLLRLGAICGIWSHVEEAMIEFFAFLLGDTQTARPILRSIVNQKARLAVMRGVLQNSPENIARSGDCDLLLDEFGSANKMRNAYIHGLWSNHGNGKTYIREPKEDYWEFSGLREVSVPELDAFIKRLYDLKEKAEAVAVSERNRPSAPAEAVSVSFGEHAVAWRKIPPKLPPQPKKTARGRRQTQT